MDRRVLNLIEVKSLSYIYNRKNPYQTLALDDLSFIIKQGEIIGIIGPSGSGKSCLLRCLAGVLTPTSGDVVFNHQESMSQKIGLIIQEPEIQFFNETVYQEVAFALENRGLNREAIDEIVRQALKKTGFLGNPSQSPFRLSGGEQRRVAIASILALNPEVLLLDEPTVGLDFNGLEMISQIINSFRQEFKSVLIVSHDLDFLYRQVDRYLVVNEGRLVADFDKADFDRNIELIAKIGLAIPEIVELQQKEIPKDLKQELLDLRL